MLVLSLGLTHCIALIEPLSVGWHAVCRSITRQTTSALVMGAGPIGLALIQALKAKGVKKIIVVDTNSARQEGAHLAGAQYFINSTTEKVPEACSRLCADSHGVQVAYDTAGKQATLDQCIASVCIGGTIVNVAVWNGPATILPYNFMLTEKRYMGTAVYTREDFDGVINAVASGEFHDILARVTNTHDCFPGIINPAFMP